MTCSIFDRFAHTLTAAAALSCLAAAPPVEPPGADVRVVEPERTGPTIVQGVREQLNRARGSVHAMSVQSRIYSRLHWDKALNGSDLILEVDRDGIATLRGAVPTAPAKLRAVQLTSETVGVNRVVDGLTVLPPTDGTAPAPVVRPLTRNPDAVRPPN